MSLIIHIIDLKTTAFISELKVKTRQQSVNSNIKLQSFFKTSLKMSLSLLLLLLGLCHTCLLTEGSEPGYYNNENESTGARILAANSKAHENLIEACGRNLTAAQ
ncbi:high choriolytic enzyme 1-like protein [Lates japonicus]|uniref:High choriolytic enzyme 1-like protein n=1 Tax=Lates japonicus TaxID=270547 RepID=A0AAD3NAY8_LATJO|nr:high choriolytic enzyme 1-like protein [Lates japonicus]